jgi:hypothetical protein
MPRNFVPDPRTSQHIKASAHVKIGTPITKTSKIKNQAIKLPYNVEGSAAKNSARRFRIIFQILRVFET